MKLRVDILHEDLFAARGGPCTCPIATALKRMGGERPSVFYTAGITVKLAGRWKVCRNTPEAAIKLMTEFDNWVTDGAKTEMPCQPVTFELEMEDD